MRLIVLASSVAFALPHAAQGQSRPNIVFLFSDDHAAHALSAYRQHLDYGARLPATPNLDRLAASGMLFVNAFVTNSICGPSRATILTGQYGHLNGVMTNAEALYDHSVTFPKLLQGARYRTALIGKWHLKSQPQGFDYYEVLAGQGPYYNPTLHSGEPGSRADLSRDRRRDRAIVNAGAQRGTAAARADATRLA